MSDILVYWTCPRCGTDHKAHLNIDSHVRCEEVDCWWNGPIDDSVEYTDAGGILTSAKTKKINRLFAAVG